jgi:hypothetical protein
MIAYGYVHRRAAVSGLAGGAALRCAVETQDSRVGEYGVAIPAGIHRLDRRIPCRTTSRARNFEGRMATTLATMAGSTAAWDFRTSGRRARRFAPALFCRQGRFALFLTTSAPYKPDLAATPSTC